MHCKRLDLNSVILRRSTRHPHYQARYFFLSRLRQTNGHHHNYFRKDSTRVNYPTSRDHLSQLQDPSSSTHEYPLPPPVYTGQSSSRSQRWTDRLLGFLAYPLLTSITFFILSQGWIPGFDKSAFQYRRSGHSEGSGGLELDETSEEYEALQYKLEMLLNAQPIFARKNQRLHTLLVEILSRSSVSASRSEDGKFPLVVRDDALLTVNAESARQLIEDQGLMPEASSRSPSSQAELRKDGIRLSNGNVVPEEDYALFRILDEEGKTRVLLLGVNSTPYEDSIDAMWPPDGYEVNALMIRIAQWLHLVGAVSRRGLEWYYYSPKATEMGWWTDGGNSWASYISRFSPNEMPQGWPMEFLRGIKCGNPQAMAESKPSQA